MSPKTAPPKREKKSINLALQGGGAHGAFTWGVLDRLLEEESLEIEAMTGTSAGAMNGVLVAYGTAMGGPYKAKKLLESFWRKISSAAIFSPIQPTLMDKFFGNNDMAFSPAVYALDFMTKMFSPYQFNLFNVNPLRDVLSELVDFRELRQRAGMKLFVNATNVRTGKIKIFSHKELTVDMLLASACLPFLYKAVEIDGESYWDGGYSGNPALYPLFYECSTKDIMLVQINPINIDEVPTRPEEIMDRVNEISFNATLMREMRAISFVTKLIKGGNISEKEYKDIHIHIIEAEEVMDGLGRNSKLNADWDFLNHLKETGRQAAEDWLNANYNKIGKESTIDIRKYFL